MEQFPSGLSTESSKCFIKFLSRDVNIQHLMENNLEPEISYGCRIVAVKLQFSLLLYMCPQILRQTHEHIHINIHVYV